MPYQQGYTTEFSTLSRRWGYERVRTEIFDLLPTNCSRILEVGCGSAATLKYLKNHGVCSWAAGIELAVEAAEVASDRIDKVYVTDAESMDIDVGERSLDVILCLDSLEHMRDPWQLVARLHTLLKPGGSLISSIPNIRHHRVLIPLIFRGRWDYAESGILDRSHLRFFTEKTAIELMSSSGLYVDKVIPRVWDSSLRRKRLFDVMALGLFRNFFPEQYLIRAINKIK